MFLEVSLKTLLFSSLKLIISLLVSKPRDLHMSEKTIEISNCFLRCLVYLKLNVTLCTQLLCMFHQCMFIQKKKKSVCLCNISLKWNYYLTFLFKWHHLVYMHWYKGQWCCFFSLHFFSIQKYFKNANLEDAFSNKIK